ncbi:DUF2752 domain-containing protein [Nocardioides sp.]|uniref:DUF2752 domain-containing protein n=1 Tax=Nocardioides sp. TaxID=35761 RepID=UPI0035184EFA
MTTPPTTPPTSGPDAARVESARWGLASAEWTAAAGVLALGVAAVLPDSSIDSGPVICPFRRLTGLPCPGCGLTRSWVHLMHGDLPAAFAVHWFGPLFAAFVVVLAVASVRRRIVGAPAVSLDRVIRHPVTVAVIGAWLAYAIVRLVLAL